MHGRLANGLRCKVPAGAIVIDAIGPTALCGEFLIEDLAAGTDGALEQVAGFLVEGHGEKWKVES